MIHGLNYPRGILAWADEIGLDHVLGVLDALALERGEERYRCAPLLRRLGVVGTARPRDGRRLLHLRGCGAMRAVTFQAPMEVRVDERPEPELESRDDAIVAIEASGICGSDLHIYHGRVRMEPGFTIGHEFVGRVVAAGDAVTRVTVGDRVLRLLSHRVRHVLLLHARRLSEVRAGAGLRPRRGAGGAAGHTGRPGAGADGQHDAAPGARRRLRRRRPVRRRRDGHRVSRHRVGRRPPGRQRGRPRTGPGGAVRGPDRGVGGRRAGAGRSMRCPSASRWPAHSGPRRST